MNNDSDQSKWLDRLFVDLSKSGEKGMAALRFVQENRIRVRFHTQPTAACWTITRQIQLHPRYMEGSVESTYAQSLIIHELRHLRQGWIIALSVRGELEAWQEQFSFIRDMQGRYYENPDLDAIIIELMSIKDYADRQQLCYARDLMRSFAGTTYRVDLLPLYPLHNELWFRLSGRRMSNYQAIHDKTDIWF